MLTITFDITTSLEIIYFHWFYWSAKSWCHRTIPDKFL